MSSLAVEIKRVRGRGLQRGDVLGKWLDAHPDVDRCEARQFAMSICHIHRPAIDTPYPKYRDRPFFDNRFAGIWSNDEP